MIRVVIVDDQRTNRRVLSKLASTLAVDVEIMAFGDPLEALSYADEHTPDLLITDYQMPMINGAELIRRFRNVHDCRDVPAVVVSAYEDSAFRDCAFEAGANEFMLSPLSHSEFRTLFGKLLAMRHSRQTDSLSSSLADGASIDVRARERGQIGPDQIDIFNGLLENVTANLILKVKELHRVNAELQNLLEIGAISAIFVDGDLRVRRFTTHVQPLFALSACNIGQLLERAPCSLKYDALIADLRLVLRTGEIIERCIAHRNGHAHYLLRIFPNQNHPDACVGATIIFTKLSQWYDADSGGRPLH
jgi:CheY-like chemotaxis protein